MGETLLRRLNTNSEALEGCANFLWLVTPKFVISYIIRAVRKELSWYFEKKDPH